MDIDDPILFDLGTDSRALFKISAELCSALGFAIRDLKDYGTRSPADLADMQSYLEYLESPEHPRVLMSAIQDAKDVAARLDFDRLGAVLGLMAREVRRALRPYDAMEVAFKRAMAHGSRNFTISVGADDKATIVEHDEHLSKSSPQVPFPFSLDTPVEKKQEYALDIQRLKFSTFIRPVDKSGEEIKSLDKDKGIAAFAHFVYLDENLFRAMVGDVVARMAREYPGWQWKPGWFTGDTDQIPESLRGGWVPDPDVPAIIG